MVKERKQVNMCHYCGYTIIGPLHKFKAHLFTHNGAEYRYKCKWCSMIYFRRDLYLNHVKKHKVHSEKNPNRLYLCAHCNKGFMNKANLKYHLRKHNDLANPLEYRHHCSVCKTSYSERRILLHHIQKVHCATNSKEPMYLSKNLNESWVETVLNSDHCVEITKLKDNLLLMTKSAITKSEFQNLVKTDAKCNGKNLNSSKTYSEVTCDYCEKIMYKKSLRKHIEEVHFNIRKFICDKCNKTFNRRYQMADHICNKSPTTVKIGLRTYLTNTI